MALMGGDARIVKLRSGTLTLRTGQGEAVDDLCDFASRANPKRGFLVVSRILGRHLPAAPSAMRGAMNTLALMLPGDLPKPVVFLGMAETATALGQGVFAAYRGAHPGTAAIYLQTSRQRVEGAHVLATFEEGHSHATSHLVQVADDSLLSLVRSARSLVIIDDECSTGNTFIGGAEAMMQAMPLLERIDTCCLTDWSGEHYRSSMPISGASHAILSGTMEWSPDPDTIAPALSATSNGVGRAPVAGMRSRAGLIDAERASRRRVDPAQGERILVLGDGEHSYEALHIAEEIEARGGIAAVQCITRTPAMLGHAMTSVSHFEDAYGSGAPCHLYNILSHDPDRIIIAAEIEGGQVDQATASLVALGREVPVEMVLCEYPHRKEA